MHIICRKGSWTQLCSSYTRFVHIEALMYENHLKCGHDSSQASLWYYHVSCLHLVHFILKCAKYSKKNKPNLSDLQSNNKQSDFSRQRRNVYTIIYFSLHACLYPHHCHQQSILWLRLIIHCKYCK